MASVIIASTRISSRVAGRRLAHSSWRSASYGRRRGTVGMMMRSTTGQQQRSFMNNRNSFSSYEYPLATEAPEVTKTLASDVRDQVETGATTAAASKLSPKATAREAAAAAGDPFDDSGTLSAEQVQELRALQKQESFLKTSAVTTPSSSPTTYNDPTRVLLPILQEIPSHIPPNVPADQLETPETLLTVLDNGIRVVSQETYGQVSTVGVVSEVGSRHETASEAGVTHLLEALAFGSTRLFPTGQAVTELLQDTLGGTRFCNTGREQSIHCIDVLRPNVDKAMGLLQQVLLEPQLLPEEVEEAKQALEFQALTSPPEILLGEALQEAAFGADQQLGQPHLYAPPADPTTDLSAGTVRAYWERQFLQHPEGLVVAGAGVRHDTLVRLATEHFGHLVQVENNHRAQSVPSEYRGGQASRRPPSDSMIPDDGLIRVALALPVTGGWHSTRDLVPACVLQTLLGGGSSFSAGGPGKGMYSRLYRQVLNRYTWAESAEAFTAFFDESGLMGISGSTQPLKVRDMVQVLSEHLSRLAVEPVTDEELDRARAMLKCNVLTQLESRLILFEDMGRQVLTYGKREGIHATCEKIDAVTKDDLQQLAARALEHPPTISAVGTNLSQVPQQEEVARWIS